MKHRLDQAFNSPVRLQIAAILARVDDAEFATVREIVDVSDSVLSKHLSGLSEAGHVQLRKAPLDGRQRTWVSLTGSGRKAFLEHIQTLQQMVANAQDAIAAQ